MNKTNTYFRLAHQIQDEAFTLSQAGKCNLYLSVSLKSIRLAVTDMERNKFVVLEDYELLSIFTPQQLAEQIRLIAAENPLLQEQRWQLVRVSISNLHFTLVPETLYDPLHQSDYLKLHSNLNQKQDLVLSYRHNSLGAVNIFAVDSAVYQALQQAFLDAPLQLVHQTSPLIRSMLHAVGRVTQPQLYAFVETNYVTILVIGADGLEFCNIFHYLSPEDFIYYIVFVMQEQKLNPEQETVTVWGDIMHDSALFNILKKYIRHVKFGERPTAMEYSYKFNDLFEHRYFELYSLHLCD